MWTLAPLKINPVSLPPLTEVKRILEEAGKSLNLPPSGISVTPIYPWILWNLWTTWNQALFENRLFSALETILKAIVDAKAWDSANSFPPKPLDHLGSTALRRVDNIPTCFGDGAWQNTTQGDRMGWVISDSDGSPISQGSESRPFVSSALVAESLALKAGLTDALNAGLSSLQLLSNSFVLINALVTGSELNEIACILHDIRSLAVLFFPLSLRLTQNCLADSLGKAALAFLCLLNSTDQGF